jgi:hypothetical protein
MGKMTHYIAGNITFNISSEHTLAPFTYISSKYHCAKFEIMSHPIDRKYPAFFFTWHSILRVILTDVTVIKYTWLFVRDIKH